MMAEALDIVDESIRVGGYWLKDVRFPNNQGMASETNDGLQNSKGEKMFSANQVICLHGQLPIKTPKRK